MAGKFQSVRQGNVIGVRYTYGMYNEERIVAMMLVPDDGDWRADTQLYDDFIKIYNKRLRAGKRGYN